MRQVLGVSFPLLALALSAVPAFSQPLACPGPGCPAGQPCQAVVEQPCLVDKICLKASVKITPCIRKKPVYVAVAKETVKEVPFTEMVPVCVTDPHTGCKCMIEQPTTVMRKVRTLCFEVKKEPKEEDKPEVCATIYLDHIQVPAPPPPCPAPAPACQGPNCQHP